MDGEGWRKSFRALKETINVSCGVVTGHEPLGTARSTASSSLMAVVTICLCKAVQCRSGLGIGHVVR